MRNGLADADHEAGTSLRTREGSSGEIILGLIGGQVNNERGMRPGVKRSSGLRGGDDVSSCLFDYTEPLELG